MDLANDPVLASIGATPLVRLERVVPAGAAEVWLKLESGNPTGSYKDRMALSVVRGALERGDVREGERLVEYTGGSTGMALAFVCRRAGLGFTAVSSDAFSAIKLTAMRAYGAEVIVEPSESGMITPELIARMRDHAYALGAQAHSHYADQFGSPDVRAGYAPMGREIADQLGRAPDVVCAGVGTGGALMGLVDGLDGVAPGSRVIALEPAQSPLITTGVGGPHRVEGIGVGFVPPFLDRERVPEVRVVDQYEAMAMSRRLAADEGILCGASTGMNVVAAIALAVELGPGSSVVTLGCDSGTKYFTGDLFD